MSNEPDKISGEGPLGCFSCVACCKAKKDGIRKVTIFKGELDTDTSPNAPFLQTMEVEGDCKHLVDGHLCGIFNDPKRYLTCIAYPWTMGANYNMYLATTCPSYVKIINGLMEGNGGIKGYVKFMYEYLRKNTTAEMRYFWDVQARYQRGIFVEIRTSIFL